jgi:hypothetical protein
MRKLVVFNQVTLDGYFAGMNGDISWAHRDNQDAEWNAFVADNANAGGLLLSGSHSMKETTGHSHLAPQGWHTVTPRIVVSRCKTARCVPRASVRSKGRLPASHSIRGQDRRLDSHDQ